MMLKNSWLLAAVVLCLCVSVGAQGPRRVALGDWPEQRGPKGDGTSAETGLPEKWALNGQNFLWRAPYGGRSAPIVMGNRVYVQNPAGRDDQLQERVMALDADTGKVVWEYRFNVFQSDVPPHRVGWASPAADPGDGQHLRALVRARRSSRSTRTASCSGSVRSARSTRRSRRTADGPMSPIIDGDLVIVERSDFELGNDGAPAAPLRRARQANRRHRVCR